MRWINQCCVRQFRLVVPLGGSLLPEGILSDCDNFKILILELFVDFLPPGQVPATPSPRSPGDDQNFLSRKSDSRTKSPSRFSKVKSGAIADLKNWFRVTRISPKLHTR
jgi:hypothetical protein